MSAKNGDKARFQKNRKRRVLHRARIRELVKTEKPGGAAAKANSPRPGQGDAVQRRESGAAGRQRAGAESREP